MKKEEHRKKFGEFLKKAIKSTGLQQKAFAEELKLRPQYISRIISGSVIPDEKNFQSILLKISNSKSVDEITTYRLSNLYDAAKYGRIRTVKDEATIADPLTKHYVEIFEKLDEAGQNKTLRVMLGLLKDSD